MSAEQALIFDCEGEPLIGVLHSPGNSAAKCGVLIVVGGPQYRVGSHRQFVLLARYLAKQGFPVLRFDVRGMGDSSGNDIPKFDDLDSDINAAVDCFFKACPDLQQLVIWGLCDGASAAGFYAYQDARIAGLVLLNPWVFTEQGAAKTQLKHYYLKRLLNRELWSKIIRGKFQYRDSLRSLISAVRGLGLFKPQKQTVTHSNQIDRHLPLPQRLRECLNAFSGKVLIILSGQDLVAQEFTETVNADSRWQTLLNSPQFEQKWFPEADHTFSSALQRDTVAEWTASWLLSIK